jgi:glycosyltransferase involved in cell wall biosynthesis
MNTRSEHPPAEPRENHSMRRVAHLTSAHPRNDPRIFFKQCSTLAARGYAVTLVVADDKGDEFSGGVRIVDVGRLSGRLNRILLTVRRVFDQALALDADIYHLHDPELIPVGLKLKRLGKTVIFDSHEDIPKQILSKPYLGTMSRHVLSSAFSRLQRYACARFDGVIAATPFIREKFLKINPNTVDVNNFPILRELDAGVPWADKQAAVCYVGSIAAVRGIRELVHASALLRSTARLNLAGKFSEPEVEAELKAHSGWARVNQHGYLDRAGVRDVISQSVAGLVTIMPLPNYVDSLPTKMFEYMASGIPVIASNFPLWREIIEGNECGICVDPLDPEAIAAAIDYLVCRPDIAKSMGERGRKVILEKYNWDVEASRLTDFYGALPYAK